LGRGEPRSIEFLDKPRVSSPYSAILSKRTSGKERRFVPLGKGIEASRKLPRGYCGRVCRECLRPPVVPLRKGDKESQTLGRALERDSLPYVIGTLSPAEGQYQDEGAAIRRFVQGSWFGVDEACPRVGSAVWSSAAASEARRRFGSGQRGRKGRPDPLLPWEARTPSPRGAAVPHSAGRTPGNSIVNPTRPVFL